MKFQEKENAYVEDKIYTKNRGKCPWVEEIATPISSIAIWRIHLNLNWNDETIVNSDSTWLKNMPTFQMKVHVFCEGCNIRLCMSNLSTEDRFSVRKAKWMKSLPHKDLWIALNTELLTELRLNRKEMGDDSM